MTAFRHLRDGPFVTSINCRGKYHASLVGMKFNRHGLCRRDGKVFSKHGNLLETVVELVSASDSGMTVSEINRLVYTNVDMQSQALFKKNLVSREKYGREYCYFSANPNKRDRQLTMRNTSANSNLNSTFQWETFDSLLEIIRILVTLVKHPEFSPKSIALSLTRRGMGVTTEKVRAVFEKYDLAKKKS